MKTFDEQVTTLGKLLEERTKIANERSKTLGTFYVRMVVTVPIINDRSRTKHVTIASWQNATADQSKYLKEKFLKSNDEYDPNHFEFSFVPYPIAI